MFQGSPEYFFMPQNESISPGMSTGVLAHGLHSTPNSQGTENEASFDSGYLSPATSASQMNSGGSFIPLTNDGFLNQSTCVPNPNHRLHHQQPLHPQTNPDGQKGLFDDEWDKKFIENFEANLFGIDPMEDFSSEDINLFSELLSSPMKSGLSPAGLFHGHSPAKFSRSPLKNLFSPPRVKSGVRTNLLLGNNWNNNSSQNTFIQPADPLPLTNMTHTSRPLTTVDNTNPNCVLDQRLSTHDYAKPSSHSYSAPNVVAQQGFQFTCVPNDQFPESLPIPNMNVEPAVQNIVTTDVPPEMLPSKQKLQYVRAKFKQTLQKAVENADNAALNEEKYPQLTKRLSKLTTRNSVKQEINSRKENLPKTFGEKSLAKQNSSSLSALDSLETEGSVTQTTSKRFRELAPALTGKRTFACIVNNQYEVKQKTDCRVLIKKRKTY